MRILMFLTIILLMIPSVSSATISGTIYDFSLEKTSNIIVEIDTIPSQKIVSKDGTFSFQVPEGSYSIKTRGEESYNIEEIKVKDNGSYIIDIILFPILDDDLLYEPETIPKDIFKSNIPSFLLGFFIFLLIIIILTYYIIQKSKAPSKLEDDLSSKIYNYIKNKKRVTQKQIRKEFPLSESKISLVITELEHKNLIEKIKKGRGNVIILK